MHSTVSPPAKTRRVFDFNDLCDPEDDQQQQSRNELAEYVTRRLAIAKRPAA